MEQASIVPDRLLKRQLQRESKAFADGANHFRQMVAKDQQQGRLGSDSVGLLLIKRGLEPLQQAITNFLEEQAAQRVQMRHTATKWVPQVGTDVAAFMTLRVVLDGVVRARPMTEVAHRLSTMIEHDLKFRRLREQAPNLFWYKMTQLKSRHYDYKAKSLSHTLNTAHDADDQPIDVSDLEMSTHERLHVGLKLIDLCIGATGLVKREDVWKGRKSTAYLLPSDDLLPHLGRIVDSFAKQLFQARDIPMVVPPLRWGPCQRGGFRFALREANPLVRGLRQTDVAKVESRDMPLVYGALNTLQETPWRINTTVYNLIRMAQQQKIAMAGIPSTEKIPLPERPATIATDEEARKKYRKKAHEVYTADIQRAIRAREFNDVMDVAQEVLTEETIYFPYSVDFRGRVYPLQGYLHPQGADHVRALLLFAEGKPLDDGGAGWLAVHGANCLGETPDKGKVSKMTFDERVEWIQNHSAQIRQVARDPFGDQWWTEADDPLQFFAFCVEWDGYCTAQEAGHTFVSHLPISMDGSCNGLQHFSALLADEVGGEAVNLVAQERPQDIYSRVAERVNDKLEAVDDSLAKRLLHSGLVNRKLCKRPTMTFGYGSKRFGFKSQIKQYFKNDLGDDKWREVQTLLTDTVDGKPKSRVNAACGLLAKLIWESLGDVVVAAFDGMAWMQKCARGIVKDGKPVEWIVPVTGFIARQDYYEMQMQRIKTVLAGSIYKPRIYTPTEKPDHIKQANAIAPNIVHSLDAAALMLTVDAAQRRGLTSFAMIHDSYGTLAADMTALMECTRQAFVRLYTEVDVAQSLYEQFAAQHKDPTKCPLPPARGSLEVRSVIDSGYFFA